SCQPLVGAPWPLTGSKQWIQHRGQLQNKPCVESTSDLPSAHVTVIAKKSNRVSHKNTQQTFNQSHGLRLKQLSLTSPLKRIITNTTIITAYNHISAAKRISVADEILGYLVPSGGHRLAAQKHNRTYCELSGDSMRCIIVSTIVILEKLRCLDPDKSNIVRCYEWFHRVDRIFMVFESLDVTLLKFMTERKWAPLPLTGLRTIIQDVATALNALNGVGLVHADLKLDNIMLVDHQRQPFRISR
ncbi:hypothetical protein INR49_017119, partial [Caranx melampygus]